MNDELTINQIMDAVNKRQQAFIDKEDATKDWSTNEWIVSLVAKIGELSEFQKRSNLGMLSMKNAFFLTNVETSLGDSIIYIALLAGVYGVNLEKAIIKTFNMKSNQLCSKIKLREDSW